MSASGAQGNNVGTEKDKDLQWYFTAEQLANSPSRRQGIDSDQELSYRQMTAYLIQEMGQRLQVLFLAAKVEEQPRKLEHVIKAANKCLSQTTSSTTDAYYMEQAQDLVFNENVLLQTLGFDVAIDHPHTHVVKTCHLVKACKDLAQTSYFLASNSLHLTSMCLQYKPTVVACFCIYLACKWSRWEIPQSTEGKHWFHYVDKTVTMDLLKQLTDEFIAIYEKSPARLKSKLNSIKALAQGASNRVVNKDKKGASDEWKMGDMMKMYHSSINTASDINNISSTSSSSSQSIAYTMQSPADQQQQPQSVSAALLPPPPPQTQQQQLRKSEMHSSQNRAHHNSSSHHHAKLSYSTGTDAPDHKSSHKQQAAFSGNMINRPRDHAQTSQLMAGSSLSQSRSSLSASSGRSSITGSGIMSGQQTSQRQSSQSHQLDINYHKPRDRGSLLGMPPTHVVAPHMGHKLSQKQQDANRVSSKESMGRAQEQVKQTTSSKMFPPVPITNIPFGSNQMQNSSQSSSKIDTTHDLSRSMLHNQRSYVGSNQVQSVVPTTIGYHQTQLSRQVGAGGSGSNSNSSSTSNKHEPAKPLSVHMQQHKQSVTHEVLPQHSQQSHTPAAAAVSYANLRPTEVPHTEDHSNPQFSTVHSGMPQMQSSQNQLKTSTSMFSPDWNDKLPNQNPLLGGSYNGNIIGNASSDSFGFKMLSGNTKESPRRSERDMPIKKEKSRTAHVPTENVPTGAVRSAGAQQQVKMGMPKKSDTPLPLLPSLSMPFSSNLSELAGTSTSGGVSANVSVKRSSELAAIKQEDEFVRDSKTRKLDSTSSGVSYTDNKSMNDMNKLQVVNGIETNPDMVRCLLKESLGISNISSALIKQEPLPAPSLLPPAELLEPTATVSCKSEIDVSAAEKTNTEEMEAAGGKSEKKKKKDKHKHKEKDKSKDREERKKHKKDKDRHKDRDREVDNSEPVKIKISKEKLEASSGMGEQAPVGFKIKIPKDRIIGDLHNNAGGYVHSGPSGDYLSNVAPTTSTSSSSTSTPALKIKISKDKLENYSSGSAEPLSMSQATSGLSASANYYASFGLQNALSATAQGANFSCIGSGVGGNSSKKKERDRDKEREKEKKRINHEFGKTNGTISMNTTTSSIGGTAPGHLLATTPLQKPTQNSSKMQPLFTNNMSQLFGESNDDDDDDDDREDDANHRNDIHGNDNAFRNYPSNVLSSSLSSNTMPVSQLTTQTFRQSNEYGSRDNECVQQLSQHSTQHQIPQR